MKKTTVWSTEDGTTLLRLREPGKFNVMPSLCDKELLAELRRAIADALGPEDHTTIPLNGPDHADH